MNPVAGLARDSEFKKISTLCATAFVDMIGFAMVFPLLPFYALRLQATPELIGWMTAAFSIAQLASSPLWGRLSDRRGRRPALLVGLIASAAAYLVFGFATSVWMIFASRLIQGAGGGTTGVAQAYIGDAIPPERRAQALGWLSASSSLGVAIGPALGSLSVRLGPEAPGLLAAGLCLLNVVFAWRWLPESQAAAHGAAARARKPAIGNAVWTVLAHPAQPVSRMIWIYGAGMLGFSAMTSVFALFLGARFGITAKSIGPFFVYVGVLSFVMRAFLLGPVVRRIGEAGAIRLGTIALVTGLAVYPFVPALWMMPMVMPLIPIGTALLFPATTALMSRASDQVTLGTTMGVAQAFAGVARIVAPVIATAAFQRLGPGSPFFVAAAIVAAVGVLAFRLPAAMTRPAPAAR